MGKSALSGTLRAERPQGLGSRPSGIIRRAKNQEVCDGSRSAPNGPVARRRGQGNSRRGREHRDDQEALRLDRGRVDRGEPTRLPGAAVHDDGVEDYISGVILFDETIRQSASDGTPFPQLLESKGIIPGIKVDMGAKPLALTDGETITEGLDGLRGRLDEYRGLGARFAKWRATYSIASDKPSEY